MNKKAKNMQLKKILLFFMLLLKITPIFGIKQNYSDKDFIKSFLEHYTLSVEGRYTREYHKSLLGKTAYSLDELEENLGKNGFNLSGRLIICGYEEQAFPSYYAGYRKPKINDEASSKTSVGWSLRLHNIFGFLTGFLFKDFNFFAEQWFKNENPTFEHIDPDEVEIFNEKAYIFQKHSFGPAFNPALASQYNVVKNFKEKNYKSIFEELINFWNFLYKEEITVGNKQIAGTQDILFSIEYARHLVRSKLPLMKFYVGPDITYPIEVSLSQPKEATIHAQNFVKIFSKNIKAINNKPTVYIFCSFVDGVGKSTMLGNIKNNQKYGDKINDFERVDNSSSQLADLFKLKENIFIADLPAQVSHFTYKPDGLVYVDVYRELSQDKIKELKNFVILNKEKFEKKYKKSLKKVKKIIDEKGALAEAFRNKDKPVKSLLRNIVITKKENTNRWIPFKFENQNYIFNKFNNSQIRMLVPLGIVQSEGLKNIETEQMLFFEGIRLPLPYSFFMEDLTNKLKINNIENVVFVDFTSMYPRSSRENIRVNYLIQQLSLLDEKFDSKFSLYRDFISDAELLYVLDDKEKFLKIFDALKLETLSRFALFKIILERKQCNLNGFSVEELTGLIKNKIENISPTNLKYLEEMVLYQLNYEKNKLEKMYGLNKNFINIQKFSFQKVCLFSDYLSDFLTNHVINTNINSLWRNPSQITTISENKDSGALNEEVQTISSKKYNGLYIFDPECKDEQKIAPFLKTLRANWYAAVVNIFDSKVHVNKFFIPEERYNVPPLFFKQGIDGKLYLLQKIFDEWDQKLPVGSKKINTVFNLTRSKKTIWGKFKDKPYRLDWKSPGTNSKLFAFDCNLMQSKDFNYKKSITTFLVQKYQKEKGNSNVMPTSKLYKALKESFLWKSKYKKMLKKAEKNTKKINKKQPTKSLYNEPKYKKKKLVWGTKEQIEPIKFMIRILVTLEMILKDPDSDIVVRFGNRKDFKAALKLFEKTTLPKYFNVIFKEKIFKNYDSVEPFPSWEVWDNITK